MTSPSERNGAATGLWTLRMLSGVHAGAEAVLADEEEATIGSHDACDLILEDAGLGERQFRLNVANGGVRLKVLDPDRTVFVDGRKIDDAADLEPYQVVACGLSSFALGPAGREWPEIPAHRGHDIEPARRDEKPLREDRNGILKKAQANGAATGIGAATGSAIRHWGMPASSGPGNRFATRAAMLAGLALLCPVLWAWLAAPQDVREGGIDADLARERIEAIALRNGVLVEVKPAPPGGGRISVTGSVGTTRDRRRFLDELAGTGIQATARITATEDLIRIVEPILDQTLNGNPGNQVTVRALENSPGTLVVAGYVEKKSDLVAARAVLERDIGAQAGVRYDVETKNDRIEILRQRLDSLGFEHRLHIQHVEWGRGRGIGLFGPNPADSRMAELIELAERFNEEFDHRPPLLLTGTDTFLGESTMELDIRAVVLGDRERVVMRNGKSHAEGTTLDNGYRIRTIEPEFIILEKPQRLGANGEGDASNLGYFILGQ